MTEEQLKELASRAHKYGQNAQSGGTMDYWKGYGSGCEQGFYSGFVSSAGESEASIEKLQALKDFVHKRLDEAGIPTHPDGEHSKAGCRIGDRLDIALNGHYVTIPKELHPDSVSLIIELAETLASKMARNQEKYGWTNEWLGDWEDECRKEMIEHIPKGDPRDVAIYCAFMIHHGWPTNDKPIQVDHSNDFKA